MQSRPEAPPGWAPLRVPDSQTGRAGPAPPNPGTGPLGGTGRGRPQDQPGSSASHDPGEHLMDRPPGDPGGREPACSQDLRKSVRSTPSALHGAEVELIGFGCQSLSVREPGARAL